MGFAQVRALDSIGTVPVVPGRQAPISKARCGAPGTRLQRRHAKMWTAGPASGNGLTRQNTGILRHSAQNDRRRVIGCHSERSEESPHLARAAIDFMWAHARTQVLRLHPREHVSSTLHRRNERPHGSRQGAQDRQGPQLLHGALWYRPPRLPSNASSTSEMQSDGRPRSRAGCA